MFEIPRKTPVLGDLPIAGRLFETQPEPMIKMSCLLLSCLGLSVRAWASVKLGVLWS